MTPISDQFGVSSAARSLDLSGRSVIAASLETP